MTRKRVRGALSRDAVLFLYLVIGAVGTASLVVPPFSDFLGEQFLFLMIALYAFSYIAWIAAIPMILIYRGSWLIVIPAAMTIVFAIAFLIEIYLTSGRGPGGIDHFPITPFIWLVAIFPVIFVCGLIWVFQHLEI